MSTTVSSQLAKHLREVFFGVNWTWANYRDVMKDISLEQAQQTVGNANSILTLFVHANYFVAKQLEVLQGKPLSGSDAESFELPPLPDEEAWQAYKQQCFENAEVATTLLEQLPDEKLWTVFEQEKYGIWYRNLAGNIEHLHYHLGQIALLKKMMMHF